MIVNGFVGLRSQHLVLFQRPDGASGRKLHLLDTFPASLLLLSSFTQAVEGQIVQIQVVDLSGEYTCKRLHRLGPFSAEFQAKCFFGVVGNIRSP